MLLATQPFTTSVGSGSASRRMSINGARAPVSNNGTALSNDSKRRVRAATHLKRASVVPSSSSICCTNTGNTSPRCTTYSRNRLQFCCCVIQCSIHGRWLTGSWFFISVANSNKSSMLSSVVWITFKSHLQIRDKRTWEFCYHTRWPD